jgi:site-specific DNA-methyltransferase (adenine-specific)
MGKKWDTDKGGRKQWCAYMEERFAEALRVCKPGAYGLVWALPRTSHWTATALEDAGWELKDCVVHLFGSGFPKSRDIGKMIENKLGATPEAKQWDGFGTNLKPASEHWILVRKPIAGTIAGNVLEWGVGGLNVDGCRVATSDKLGGGAEKPSTLVRARHDGWDRPWMHDDDALEAHAERIRANVAKSEALGRFPANLVLSHAHDCTDDGCADGCPVKELDEQTGILKTGGDVKSGASRVPCVTYFAGTKVLDHVRARDEGGASKYFPKFHYYPKASTSDRSHKGQVQNNHPTVKNRELMRWLCRLVTPPGGTVLDCFAGSGSTAIACLEEGFNYILIEQDTESVQTANDRVNVWLKENKPQPTIEERLTWLETKVDMIDARTRKTKKASDGQLPLFGEVS